jgi:hypothetical protein
MSFTSRLKKLFGFDIKVKTSGSLRDELDSGSVNSNVIAQATTYYDSMNVARQKRQERYDVYDSMDEMVDIASVLDAYAEDATQVDNKTNRTIWVEAKDKRVQDTLNDLIHNRLNTEDTVESTCRDVAKYGDDYARVFGDHKNGITTLKWKDPRDIERIESGTGLLIGYEELSNLPAYQQKITTAIASQKDIFSIKPTYKPWDIIHFRLYKKKRLPNEKRHNVYGTSVLSSSDRIAKQVKILDDMLMIMRLTRSLDRKTYYVDVGRSPIEEEIKILKKWKKALSGRINYVDPATGRFDSRFDPFAWTANEYWPVKENRNSRVEVTSGMTNVSDIVDIEHFDDKLFGSLRAPKAYFGREGDIEQKQSLSGQSLKWARSVQSLQRTVVNGYTRMCQIHLSYLGMDPDKSKFNVIMVPPSLIELLNKLEAWQNIVDVAERLSALGETLNLNKYDWTKYIMENVLWLTDQETKRFIRKIPRDIGMGDEEGEKETLPKKEPEKDEPEKEVKEPEVEEPKTKEPKEVETE